VKGKGKEKTETNISQVTRLPPPRRRRSSPPARCARRRRTAWPAASVVRRSSLTRTTKRIAPSQKLAFFLDSYDCDVHGCDRGLHFSNGLRRLAYDSNVCVWSWVRRLDIHKISMHGFVTTPSYMVLSVKKIEVDLDKQFKIGCCSCVCDVRA
jgi:hypothetical protein